MELHPPMGAPKDGRSHKVIVVCRVSSPGEGKQDQRSLDDQEVMYRRWLDTNLGGPYELTVIAGTGSGELLNREEYTRLIELIEAGRHDFVLCEDLGRIIRRVHAHLVCELAEDTRTRLFAINDHVDTAVPGWREASIFAAFHHERSNRDTSERIKRTHRNRFANGGCVREPAYGWVKPLGAKHDSSLAKDPAAEPIYREWFRMLEDDSTYADVARWLRSKGIKFPTRRRGEMRDPDGKSVARHTRNPMLKGVRERNRRKSRRINGSGQYVSEKAAASDLLVRSAPHLSFFEAAYFDRVIRGIDERNGRYRRAENPSLDPCLNRPKKATRFPGRVAFCGICGHHFVWGGHGQRDHMMCDGVRHRVCWNGVTFDGVLAARRIAETVLHEVEQFPDFDSTFLMLLQEEAQRLDNDRQQLLADRERRYNATVSAISNLIAFIKNGKAPDSIAAELQQLEEDKGRLMGEIVHLRQAPSNVVEIPPIGEIKSLLRDRVSDLAQSSMEFANVMRKLVPRIVVFPVRLCDEGRLVLRGKFRLEVANLLPDRRAAELLRGPLSRIVAVDLFEHPQREQFREKIMALRAEGISEREAAKACGITATAAQHAAALQRKMDALGLTDPYIFVSEPPGNCPKLRSHKHPDYCFRLLPGAGEL